MSSPYLEGLEFKEATPSIAPSIYESFQYTKKWRIVIAVGIGVCLMAVCVLVFYLSTKSRHIDITDISDADEPFHLASGDDLNRWRSLRGGQCIADKQGNCPEEFGEKSVIVLGFGGLTNSHIEHVPALKELIKCGVTTESLMPSYPAFSNPNLYTIATGLYPESHGIIGSNMIDPNIDSNFSLGSPSSHVSQWWKGEPLWNTATKHGKRSATYLWPGSNVEIQNLFPTMWEKEKLVFGRRIRQVISWLQLPSSERPHLMMMFYEEPLVTSQKLGPSSEKVKSELRKINSGLDDLMAFLEREELINCVDVVVVSDQGVAPSSCEDSIYIDDLINENIPATIFTGSVGRIQFNGNSHPKIRNEVLRKIQCQLPNLRVLTKPQVPKRYHYTNNDRIGDLILDTNLGSRVSTERENECPRGSVGYNNHERQMQGTFLAHGPSFKTNFKIRTFQNIEIYNLLCSLLKIEPALNNGTAGSLDQLLLNSKNIKTSKPLKVSFLKEKIHPRPNRPGKDIPDSTGEECFCDGSHLTEPVIVTTPLPTPTMDTTTTSSHSTVSDSSSTKVASSTTSDPAIATSTSESSSIRSNTTNSTKSHESISSVDTNISSILTITNESSLESKTILAQPSTSSSLSIEDTETPFSQSPPLIKTSDIVALDLPISSAENATLVRQKRNKPSPNSISMKDFIRNDTNTYMTNQQSIHCPWGCPKYSAPEVASDTHNILLQSNYVIGLPESLSLGIWSSFTITKEKLDELNKLQPTLPEGVRLMSEKIKQETPMGCWIADPRLNRTSTDQCSRSYQTELYEAKNISLRQLYPEELEFPEKLTKEGFLLSNLAPMHWGFVEDGRRIMLKIIKNWTVKKQTVNVLFGPIFDYNLNGRKDDATTIRNIIKPLVPTNYFFVLSFCDVKNSGSITSSLGNCIRENLQVFSFVFPNLIHSDKCLMSDEEYLDYHMTSLKDIELLTGLRFFRSITDSEYSKLVTMQHLKFPRIK